MVIAKNLSLLVIPPFIKQALHRQIFHLTGRLPSVGMRPFSLTVFKHALIGSFKI